MCNLSKDVEDRGIAIGCKKGREEGREEGRKQGRKEGRENEKKATARRLQKMGMPIEVIAQSVDRNMETVMQWLSEAETSN